MSNTNLFVFFCIISAFVAVRSIDNIERVERVEQYVVGCCRWIKEVAQ